MTDIFKYSELKHFLQMAKSYAEVTSFENIQANKGIILRHDVDFDVEPAYHLAQIEKECGLRSTFFFLTSSSSYNLNSLQNRKILNELNDEGFEIALHFDPTLYPNENNEGLEEKAIFEASIIENVIGKKIKSLSLHNPSIHGQYPLFNRFVNAYDPCYFQPENYMSDSRMSFRDKDPYEFIKKASSNRLQILLHPIHYSKDGGNYVSLLCESVYRFADNLHEYISVNSQYIKDMNGKNLRGILFDTD